MTKKHKIALLSGDGVGPELIESASLVLEAVKKSVDICLETQVYPFGKEEYERFGEAIPAQTINGIKESSAILLGAVTVAGIPSPSPVGFLRKHLNLYADLRPVRSLPGAWSLKPNIDLVCIRENTEGFLADRNLHKGYGEFMPSEDLVLSLRVVSRKASERIARFAFDYARSNQRKKITVLHKAAVLKDGCGLFLNSVRNVAQEYPEIELTDEYIDHAANKLIASPESYDVILTTNLFGDIISDEAAALVSSLVPTANIGPCCGMFMPIKHTPQPEHAGRGTVNPLGMILSTGMMLNHLGEKDAGLIVQKAVEASLIEGMLEYSSTAAVTDSVCQKIQAL